MSKSPIRRIRISGNKYNIRILGRIRSETEQGKPNNNEDTIVYRLSAKPDSYWAIVFTNSWAQEPHQLPDELFNAQANCLAEQERIFVNIPKELPTKYLLQLESELRSMASLTNKLTSND